MTMTVNDLIKILLDADADGTVVIKIPTDKWYQETEISNVNIRKWGVEIETGMIDSNNDDPCSRCQEWDCDGCRVKERG